MAEDWQSGGFGLYIHWPFCEAKCPYCDFNSHVSRDIDQSRWLKAYQSEIARARAELPDRVLNSVFFGGGTPSLMNPDVVAGIMDAIRQSWPTANDLEVTLEANPGSVEAGRFAAYRQAGVSRISMGIQSLNDEDLRRLGRIHSVSEAKAAFDVARREFERVSFDLIYARQNQTISAWKSELQEALTMAIDHLSLYQLTIESGTAFGDRYERGKLRGLPPDDLAADMYELTQSVCADAGFYGYEVSNYAGIDSESRHNLIYWRYGDYVGIGPGAHGRITLNGSRHSTESWRNPDRWLREVELGNGENLREPLTCDDQAAEFLMMGLRLSEGLDLRRFERLAGHPLNPKSIARLIEIGMITQNSSHIIATQAGRMVLNSVLAELLVD